MTSSLDPIFPLPAGTGMSEIKEGDGKVIFDSTSHVSAGMPYRSFWVMWEQVERIGRMNYPKYAGSTNAHARKIAQTYLDAVVWCRQMAYPDIQIEPISEEKAQKIRAKEAAKNKSKSALTETTVDGAKPSCPQDECGSSDVIRSTVAGQKMWKCRTCFHRWPREASEAPTSPPKASKSVPSGKTPEGKKKKSKKDKGRGKKKARA